MPGGNNSYWWSNAQGWRPTAQGGPEGGGGGYGSTYPVTPGQYRDTLDAARSGAFGGRTGEATWPDGYLQPSRTRREARPAAVYGRLTDRSYQRGVNAGVKMSMEQYFWPAEQDPRRGLRAQAAAVPAGSTLLTRRSVPYGDTPRHLPHGPGQQDAQASPDITADWLPQPLW